MISFSILLETLASGPMWYKYIIESQNTCHKNWWLNIIYLNNIFRLNNPQDGQQEVSFEAKSINRKNTEKSVEK